MISTGNDIVALNAVNIARTRQQNFYRKIINAGEKALFDRQFSHSMPFEHFVWLLWSIKESVYKYLQRINSGLVFSPTKIAIGQLQPPVNYEIAPQTEGRDFNAQAVYSGVAAFGPHTLYSRSIASAEFIFSAVNHINNFERVLWGIKLTASSRSEDQSEAVREFAMGRLNPLFPGCELQISKSADGYPVLVKNGAEIQVPLSLAHHDLYVAYSFVLNP